MFGPDMTSPPPFPANSPPAPKRSHFFPRTRDGWVAVIAFLGLFALTQPPLLFVLANRIEPRLLGMPFLYTYLLVVYLLQIAVLIWAQRRNV